MKNRNYMISACASLVLFILMIVLLKNVDVQAIGPEGSSVGFAGLNGFVHESIGESSLWYNISKVCGILTIAVMCLFAAIGAWQLYQGKSLQAVDRRILAMGCVYVLLIILYIAFTKIAVNYRPVLEDGQLESSFPSTHTMLACTVFGCAAALVQQAVTRKITQKWILRMCLILSILTVVSRFLSGVHWFTDILGGIVISVLITSVYCLWLGMSENRAKQ